MPLSGDDYIELLPVSWNAIGKGSIKLAGVFAVRLGDPGVDGEAVAVRELDPSPFARARAGSGCLLAFDLVADVVVDPCGEDAAVLAR
ncbi:hypothetical protein ABTX15_30860 [Micromonospora sp. NPDC094482]|uniref:hypothetical protein n=1 Tax=unclassified Micromonospora TaxID=2617518 RepID=UPI00331CF561